MSCRSPARPVPSGRRPSHGLRPRIGWSVLVLLASSAAAFGAPNTPAPDSRDQPPSPPPLAGPKVPEKTAAPSLVERGIDGKIRRPESTPEQAALRLIELDRATTHRLEQIVAGRARILEHFVQNNLDLLILANTAQATGNRLDQLLVAVASFRELLPLWNRGSLRSELEAALPEGPRAQFGRLLEEYWDAVVDEHRRAEPAQKFTWFGSMAQERLAIVGKEIERAFQREEKSGAIAYAYLMKDLGLSPAQERRVRGLIMEFTEKGGDSLPKAEKDRFFAGVLAMLTPEQAGRLLAKIRGEASRPPARELPRAERPPADSEPSPGR